MFSLEVEGEHVVGFTLHGMSYREVEEKYKQGEKLEVIQYPSVLGRSLTSSIISGTFDLMECEFFAVRALEWYLSDFLCEVKSFGTFRMLSTDRGSILSITEYGELGGVILKHPSDLFVVRALMKRYYSPKAWCYAGDIMDCVLEKLPEVELYDHTRNGLNHYSAHNPSGETELQVAEAIKGLPLRLWEISNV